MSEAQKASRFYQLLQGYSEWSSQVLRAAFYPEKILRQAIPVPEGVKETLEELVHENQLAELTIADTLERQLVLIGHAEQMLASRDKPPLEDFDTFLNLYEDFTARLARLDMDSVLSDFGVDSATGLRSANAMIPDLERELERRARRGHAFSIVLCQVDQPVPAQLPAQIKLAAGVIRTCMRSFDDAYMSGKNEMLVSLKQTDNSGALRFVERLKFALSEKGVKFTMSYCAAEPMPGDDLKALLANVRADLKEISDQGAGETGEYEEISPLQRFIKSMTPDKS